MATYIMLMRYTQQGIEKIKEGPSRLDASKKIFESMGAKVKDFYLVMGQYDTVAVIEAPDDETISKLALGVGSKGAVRTETLRAYTEDEFRKIVAGLP
ncbi:Glutamine synthetase and cystathionine beta-lyase binding protein [subsurface metagenome]